MNRVAKKQILITGGTGLIGESLIEYFIALGGTVFVLTRHVKKAQQQFNSNDVVKQVKCTVKIIHSADSSTLTLFNDSVTIYLIESLSEIPALQSINWVINLAGEPIVDRHWSEQQKHNIWRSRVDFTKTLVEWMQTRENLPEVLISGSAVGWYGDGEDRILDETCPPHHEFTHELCDAWERAAMVAESLNVRVCVVRTGIVLSPRGGFMPRLLTPFKLGLATVLGDGNQYLSWIHIQDMVRAIVFLIHNESRQCHGEFNLTAPQPVTNREFTQLLCEQLKRWCLFRVPEGLFELTMGERARLLIKGQRVIPARLESLGFEFKFSQLKSALGDILIDC
ncbi:TIGR01777 family oxidoreductase [Aliikangiella maris]|uniref:TIGR01777 family oxidoreductase n=2 Tax=Aliikangiella maris TaxID=3162458 RepID=A0ABV3MK79_9GAMM